MIKNMISEDIWTSFLEVSPTEHGPSSAVDAGGAKELKKLGQLPSKLVKRLWPSFPEIGFLIGCST
eukprot:7364160-Pyramimonas_sp.AAC.1